MPDDRIQVDLPISPASCESVAELKSQETHVYCMHCFRSTERLKVYNVGKIIFLWAGVIWDYDTIVACPSCMRKALVMRTLISIITANLVFPIVAFFYLCQIVATCFGGHSDSEIANEHRRSLDDRFLGAEHAIRLWSWPDLKPIRRFLFLILIAVVAFPVVFALMGLLMWLINKE